MNNESKQIFPIDVSKFIVARDDEENSLEKTKIVLLSFRKQGTSFDAHFDSLMSILEVNHSHHHLIYAQERSTCTEVRSYAISALSTAYLLKICKSRDKRVDKNLNH